MRLFVSHHDADRATFAFASIARRIYNTLFCLPPTVEPFRSEVQNKALLIVPSYVDSQPDLARLDGTWNDAMKWQEYLMRHGYLLEDIIILSEKLQPMYHPTNDNIRRELFMLMAGVQHGQGRFLLFSGHRTSLPSKVFRNRKYGAILPSEGVSKYIPDSDIRGYLLPNMRPGVRLTVIMDSCYVGLPLQLPWVYDVEQDEFRVVTPWRASSYALGSILLIGACQAHQQAREVMDDSGEKYGGLSYYLTQAMRECGESSEGISQQDIYRVARDLIGGGQNMVVTSSILTQDFQV